MVNFRYKISGMVMEFIGLFSHFAESREIALVDGLRERNFNEFPNEIFKFFLNFQQYLMTLE